VSDPAAHQDPAFLTPGDLEQRAQAFCAGSEHELRILEQVVLQEPPGLFCLTAYAMNLDARKRTDGGVQGGTCGIFVDGRSGAISEFGWPMHTAMRVAAVDGTPGLAAAARLLLSCTTDELLRRAQ
jgi:hypothetical protein